MRQILRLIYTDHTDQERSGNRSNKSLPRINTDERGSEEIAKIAGAPADQDVHPELIVETASARRSMLAQMFQRELPGAAWLQRAVIGIRVPSASFGISPARSDAHSTAQLRLCGAYAPTPLRMTSFEMVWLTARLKPCPDTCMAGGCNLVDYAEWRTNVRA
jgi:hypothetical protein